jgi:UDP-N-acetylmuramoyl-tripeptide--D-alanyl-D-alanine ligase
MMVSMTLSQLATEFSETLGAQLHQGDASFTRVSTDTRRLNAGDLFVALRGENFDAHDFLADAAHKACALVVEKLDPAIALPQLVVRDTLLALGQIAVLNRAAFSGPLVAITGSSGKTTVKTMLAAILRECGPTLATEGNLNNHIGVPLTLLKLASEHRYAVIEMGASAAGEIAYLCGLARPDAALVNNVMPAHIEGFGSIEGVAAAKGEIYQGLSESGTMVVNLDEPFAGQWLAEKEGAKVLGFSLRDSAADFYVRTKGESAAEGDHERQRFTLVTPAGEQSVELCAPGDHNLRNALAAAACAYAVGASNEQIGAGLGTYIPIAGRMNRQYGHAGAVIIDDSYNANPGSVRAAIDVLATQPLRSILVLGDMAELGDESAALHTDIGAYASTSGVQELFTHGLLSRHASDAFGEGAQHFSDRDSLIQALKEQVDAQTCVLIKGSRSARMELVVRALIDSGERS